MVIDSVTKPIEFGQTLAKFNSSNRSGTELIPGAWLVPGHLKFVRPEAIKHDARVAPLGKEKACGWCMAICPGSCRASARCYCIVCARNKTLRDLPRAGA